MTDDEPPEQYEIDPRYAHDVAESLMYARDGLVPAMERIEESLRADPPTVSADDVAPFVMAFNRVAAAERQLFGEIVRQLDWGDTDSEEREKA